jgi:hypothetical protein
VFSARSTPMAARATKALQQRVFCAMCAEMLQAGRVSEFLAVNLQGHGAKTNSLVVNRQSQSNSDSDPDSDRVSGLELGLV